MHYVFLHAYNNCMHLAIVIVSTAANYNCCVFTFVESVVNPQRLRTWTGKFCALADRESFDVPSQSELIMLSKNGLGIKDITLHLEDDAEIVNEKLLRFLHCSNFNLCFLWNVLQ